MFVGRAISIGQRNMFADIAKLHDLKQSFQSRE